MPNEVTGALLRELKAAVESLAKNVVELQRHLTVSRRQWRLTRFLLVIVFVGLLSTGYVLYQQRATAVATCKANNNQREANRILWNYILDTSIAAHPDLTKADRGEYKKIEEWIDVLFQQRDCRHLNKTYPIPDPPKVVLNLQKKVDTQQAKDSNQTQQNQKK